MRITIYTKSVVGDEGQLMWNAYAFTDGIGLKSQAPTKKGALFNLHKKLKAMHKFTRIARSMLEVNMGLHYCTVNIKQPEINENKSF